MLIKEYELKIEEISIHEEELNFYNDKKQIMLNLIRQLQLNNAGMNNNLLEKDDVKQTYNSNYYIRIDGLQIPGINNTSSSSYYSLDTNLDSILNALVRYGVDLALKDTLISWIPHNSNKDSTTIESSSKDTQLWSGYINNTCYNGSYKPMIKAKGIIHNAAPYDILQLLIDSKRVKEYNKMCTYRHDLYSFFDGDSYCKITQSRSKPPLMKSMDFCTLLYARNLNDDMEYGYGVKGYIVVGRGVVHNENDTNSLQMNNHHNKRCEILLGVNIIRPISSKNDQPSTELITVNHVYVPDVPMFIGKKVAFNSALNFINDVQSIFIS